MVADFCGILIKYICIFSQGRCPYEYEVMEDLGNFFLTGTPHIQQAAFSLTSLPAV